jgi:hypothetical protein
MPDPPQRRSHQTSYRIVCYEIENGKQTMIFDATARGFIAVTGTIAEDGPMHGQGTHAGPLALRRRLARLIAEDKQLS